MKIAKVMLGMIMEKENDEIQSFAMALSNPLWESRCKPNQTGTLSQTTAYHEHGKKIEKVVYWQCKRQKRIMKDYTINGDV